MQIQSLNKQSLSNLIKAEASNLGFLECGISKAEYLPNDAKKMEHWLSEGNNGKMTYLENNRDKRYNPSILVEGAKSVITVLYNYFPEKEITSTNKYKISKYAYGGDYHYIIKENLKNLLAVIEEKSGKSNSRVFTDSAPILDRAWARKSGLGFIGKNTLLINRKAGSFFFIGHIITDVELHYENTVDPISYCGSCSKCIDACPTNAIKDNYVDARSCISYLTIEYKGDIPQDLHGKFDNWIFGCDICQDVCPWNRFSSPHSEPLFEPSEALLSMNKVDFDRLDKPHFKKLFKNTAVMRTGFSGLVRNVDFVR
jgi:epoxyqueuosine reductase